MKLSQLRNELQSLTNAVGYFFDPDYEVRDPDAKRLGDALARIRLVLIEAKPPPAPRTSIEAFSVPRPTVDTAELLETAEWAGDLDAVHEQRIRSAADELDARRTKLLRIRELSRSIPRNWWRDQLEDILGTEEP